MLPFAFIKLNLDIIRAISKTLLLYLKNVGENISILFWNVTIYITVLFHLFFIFIYIWQESTVIVEI